MLDSLHTTVQFERLDESSTISLLSAMKVGDIRAFLIRAQNASIVFRKQENATICESFEVSPKTEDVMNSRGKLICSFPGPAIEVPAAVFDDKGFLSELVNFLAHMNEDVLDAASTTHKAQSTVLETRDTTHPRYITELLTGILRSVGHPVNTARISKRVGDDVVWYNSELPWRRSSLWLLIRVVLHASLERSTLGRHTYKTFMLFLMCYLAKEDTCAELPNDLLHVMSAKISRRLRKLGSFAPDWLSHMVLQTCTSLRSTLDDRWRRVQDTQHISPLWTPSQLNLAQDTQLSLLSSGDYIRKSLAHHDTNSPDTHFHPEHRPRGSLDDFLSSDGAFFEEAYHTEPHVALYDVERAVEQGIDVWVDEVTNNSEACEKLEILSNKYATNALKTYGSNPELLSVMLLTTIELWVALDKIAIKDIPMLADYSPEIPATLLEDLLLCKKENLDRLRRAYQYLSHRHSLSNDGWSVFSSTITVDSFAIRFYRDRTSSQLQRLKARIEKDAQEKYLEKLTELENTNAWHAELRRMAAKMDHEYRVNQYGNEYHAWRRCTKCSYEDQIQSKKIHVHEWPLPEQQLHAEVVVFELDCPVSFNMWRTATFHLLIDLCALSVESKNPYIQLHKYSALLPYFVRHPRSRITLASDTKPSVKTHYNPTSIPATKESVCVNNGLKFYGFDSGAGTPVSEALGHVNIRKYCTYRLQRGLYENLQRYVDGTSHSSNEVMANQVECHEDLSIHEFIAFGHLRSGNLLQWLNILRELRGRSLSFHRPEVHFLLAQAVSQVGSLSDMEWTSHQEIQQPSFCLALLDELEGLLYDVEGNWLEAITMDTISFLLRRLLACSPGEAISRKSLELLRTVRCRVFSWIKELSDKLTKVLEDEDVRGALRDAAAICRCTFDVDPSTIPKVLGTAKDIEILLSCAISIQHLTPTNVSSLSSYSRLLLDRNRRLSLALQNLLRDVIQADPRDQGINLAISWVWPDYRPDSKWTPLENPNSRWLFCRTAATDSQHSQEVHFNLLDGSLLVNGKPIGRLPSDIQHHPLFNRLFGGQVLEVMPSDRPGMDYSTRGRISNHWVHFSLRDKDLVIRAIAKGGSETIELIPPEKLDGDLPTVLIEGHAHWLNLSTSVMEIRPLDSPWKSSSRNWRIDCVPGRYRLHRGQEILVDTRSKSWKMVSSLLRPLDTPRNLIITVSPVDSSQPSSSLQLSVLLPRYDLSFYVDGDGDLQSYNIRGMVYDENQSIGTLFGLVNQLVLRPKFKKGINAEELVPRCVLIPMGKVSFRTNGHHVRVGINTRGPALGRVTYQTYRIDTDLGCLAGNASLTNKLFCAYLHALTSGCGTDPLTGRSGTEESLSLLRSASCWSIMKFSSHDAKLLRLIASICPSRTWYPKHLKCMQTVEWLDLPVNSQHHGFYLACKGINKYYERVRSFHEGQPVTLKSFPSRDEHLLERSAQRAAYLFPFDFSEKPSSTNYDVRYSGRDLVETTSREHHAYAAANVVYRRIPNSTTNKDVVVNLLKSWTATVSRDAVLSLQYDKSWLAPNLPLIWLKAYILLRRNDESKWFQLLFSLPAMAYASPELSNLAPAFVAFAMDPKFRSEDPPHYHAYDLSQECQSLSTILRNYVADCAHSFERSPESNEPARFEESPNDLRKRQYKMYHDRLSNDTDKTVQLWLDAWPSERPPLWSLDSNSYDTTTLRSNVQTIFASRYRNLKLKEHLSRVQQLLDSTHSRVIPLPTHRYSYNPSQCALSCILWSLTVEQLFARPAPSLPGCIVGNTSLSGPAMLHQLIATTEANAAGEFQRRYVSALHASADCFGSEMSLGARGVTEPPNTKILEAHYALCRASYVEGLEHLKQHLGPGSQTEKALERSGQWPRITAHTLFRSLASNSPVTLSDDWARCLTKLALLALGLQRVTLCVTIHLN